MSPLDRTISRWHIPPVLVVDMQPIYPLSYCAKIVRDHDYDRYLCTLLAPIEMREAWFTLFAFNHEVAVIAEMVSEELIGVMRLAFWREALDKIYSAQAAPAHPVAEALARAIHAYRLPRAPFDSIIEARGLDLQQEQFATFAALENYCRDTSGTLLQLCAIAANQPMNPLLNDLGIAWALIGMARAHRHDENIATGELTSAAANHVQAVREERSKSLRVFAPFIDACVFHLKHLQRNAGKPSQPFARVRLILALSLRSLV